MDTRQIYNWVDGKESPATSGIRLKKINLGTGLVDSVCLASSPEDVRQAVTVAEAAFLHGLN